MKTNLGADPVKTMANYTSAIDDLKLLLKNPAKLSFAVFCKKHGISSNVIRALLRMNMIRKLGSGRSSQFHWVGNSVMSSGDVAKKVREVIKDIYAESRKQKSVTKPSGQKIKKGIQALYDDALSGNMSFQRVGEYLEDMSQWNSAVALGIFSVKDWKIVANPDLKRMLPTAVMKSAEAPVTRTYSPNTTRTYVQLLRQLVANTVDGKISIDKAKSLCKSVGYTPLKVGVEIGLFRADDNMYILVDKSASAIDRMIDTAFARHTAKPTVEKKSVKKSTISNPDASQIASEMSTNADAKELAKMWTDLGDFKMAISVLKKITSCILLSFFLILTSCKGDSKPNYLHFMGTEIAVVNGDHEYFVKMIGGDSLFVNVVTAEEFGGGFWSTNSFSYMFYTKGHNVSSITWDTGGKHSKRVTVTQDK